MRPARLSPTTQAIVATLGAARKQARLLGFDHVNTSHPRCEIIDLGQWREAHKGLRLWKGEGPVTPERVQSVATFAGFIVDVDDDTVTVYA